MIFDICHSMQFDYSKEIFIEPLTVRLTPRADSAQQVLSSALSLEPPPAGMSSYTDIGGNSVTVAWFEGLRSELRVVARSRVRTVRTNPYDFLLEPDATTLPIKYADLNAPLAAVYLAGEADTLVGQFARDIGEEVGGSTTRFLDALARRIREVCTPIERADGDPWTAKTTLEMQTGACRDLAILYMEGARSVGLASRFVSGYWLHGLRHDRPELHAWAEVYLPGAGWRGWDPTAGLAVAGEHIALAAGPTPQLAAPTSGAIRGEGVRSMLSATIDATVLPDESTR